MVFLGIPLVHFSPLCPVRHPLTRTKVQDSLWSLQHWTFLVLEFSCCSWSSVNILQIGNAEVSFWVSSHNLAGRHLEQYSKGGHDLICLDNIIKMWVIYDGFFFLIVIALASTARCHFVFLVIDCLDPACQCINLTLLLDLFLSFGFCCNR